MALTVGPAPSSKSSSSLSPSGAGVSPSAAGPERPRRRALRPRPRPSALALGGAGHAGRDDAVDAAVGLFEVDHLAQQDAAGAELLAPDHDRFEGQGAFAQAADHGVAAGFDALGDGDFALARQQLDAAHLAQVHPHRVVRAVEGRRLFALDDVGFFAGDDFAALAVLRVFFGLDDVDAHLRQHGQGVFDGLGGDFLAGQHLVQLVHGDVAAGLGLLDELLDAGVGQVEQGAVAAGGFGRFGFGRLSRAHQDLRTGCPRRRKAGKNRSWR
jgi:hypothetical protein